MTADRRPPTADRNSSPVIRNSTNRPASSSPPRLFDYLTTRLTRHLPFAHHRFHGFHGLCRFAAHPIHAIRDICVICGFAIRHSLTANRYLLTAILVAHFLLAAAYSVLTPLGEAPDEADHWAYVAYLARERRLPDGPTLTQAKHPPLYHATAALIASLLVPDFGHLDTRLFLRANPDVQLEISESANGRISEARISESANRRISDSTSPKSQIRNSKFEIRNPKSEIPNPHPAIRHSPFAIPKPLTANRYLLSANFFIHTTYEDWPWRDGPLAFHLARLWSVLLSALTLWATYHLMRTALCGADCQSAQERGGLSTRPTEQAGNAGRGRADCQSAGRRGEFAERDWAEWVALGTVGILAFIPEFNFISGAVNNDNAAALFGTLALWGGLAMYRAGGQFRAGWWTPLALGLGVWAKVSTLALWPVVALAILLGTLRGANQRGKNQRISEWANQRFNESQIPNSKSEIRNPKSEIPNPKSPPRHSPFANHGFHRLGRSAAHPVDAIRDICVICGFAIRHSLSAIRYLLTAFIPALLIAGPWFLRNWRLYGDPMGWEMVRQTVDLRMTPWTWADTWWLLKGWFVSFWGRFGGAGHIPMAGPVYRALVGLTALAGLGLIRVGLGRRWRGNRTALGLLLLAGISTGVAIWRYSLVALGTDQGRLLYPAVGALVGLFWVGLVAWVCPVRPAVATAGARGQSRPAATQGQIRNPVPAIRHSPFATPLPANCYLLPATLLAVGLSLVLGLYGLLGVIRPAFAPPPPAPEREWRRLSRVEAVDFGDLALVAWDLSREPVLYWRAEARPTRDWRVVLRVTAEDGTLVWEWKRSPGRGKWSTDHWPRGYVMRDVYRVRWPEWAGPARYRVEVGVYPFLGDLVVPTRAGQPAASPQHPFVFLGWVER